MSSLKSTRKLLIIQVCIASFTDLMIGSVVLAKHGVQLGPTSGGEDSPEGFFVSAHLLLSGCVNCLCVCSGLVHVHWSVVWVSARILHLVHEPAVVSGSVTSDVRLQVSFEQPAFRIAHSSLKMENMTIK